MLNAFRDRLIEMSRDPRDPYTAIIRRIVGARAALHFEAPLRRMVLAMPDMIRQVGAWSEEPAQPPHVRRLHAFVLRYLYHPADFLSERNLGFFGYVDDAYLVAGAYQRTLAANDAAGMKPFVEQPDIARAVPHWLKAAQVLLPNETTRMDQILDELKYHGDTGFHWAINRASRGTTLSRKLEKELAG